MKKILVVMCLFACNATFAMSCPSTGTIIDTGYSEAQILQLCGKPISMNAYKTTANLHEEWVYYKKAPAANLKVTMTFSYGHLANINTIDTSESNVSKQDQNLTSSEMCGQMIQVGNGIAYVRSICGNPATEKVLSSVTDEMKELAYKGPGPTVLVFKNGKLLDWKY